MTNKKILIKAFYDIGSPYSYVALTILKRYVSSVWAETVEVSLQPVLIGGIFKATGNKPPISLPARSIYMKNDFVRMAKWAGLNLKVPSAFPIISLNAMRLLTLVKNTKPEFLWSASMALFKSYWQDSANIADNQVLANSLQDYAGFTATQANELVELSQNSQNKQNLMKDTDEAINIGLFGCPTFLVKRSDVPKQMYESLSDPSYAKDYEIFFGADRIPVMAFFLELPYFGSLAEKELNPNLAKI